MKYKEAIKQAMQKLAKDKRRILIIGIFMIGLVYAQDILPPGGGGSIIVEISEEEFYESANNFTRCLIDNCDSLCKEFGYDNGYYHVKYDSCWCENYIQTNHGKIKGEEGWIEVTECFWDETEKSETGKGTKLFILISMVVIGILLGFFIGFFTHNYWCDWKNKYEKLKLKNK